MPIKKKAARREKIREHKALLTTDIESAIEQELLDRLKEGVYGDIYNFNPKVFNKVMDNQEVESENEVIISSHSRACAQPTPEAILCSDANDMFL